MKEGLAQPAPFFRLPLIFFNTKEQTPNGPRQLRLLAGKLKLPNSAGTSIPSECLNPTARILGSSTV